jgi:hypothetical protein
MTEQPLTKKTVDVLGSKMAYHERGQGRAGAVPMAVVRPATRIILGLRVDVPSGRSSLRDRIKRPARHGGRVGGQ